MRSLLFCLLLALPCALPGQTIPAATIDLRNKYVAHNGVLFDSLPVLQTALHFPFNSGWVLDSWISMATSPSEHSPNFGNEIDLSLSWTRSFKGWEYVAGATYILTSPIVVLPGDNA